MTIAPDTKNWTWVLERTCSECGFDTRAARREDLATLIRTAAARWSDILTAPKGVRDRPSADVWSPLEYGCHVRDVFRVFAERVHLMLTHDDPLFQNWDQDVTAVEERYGEQDPHEVAVALCAAAESLAATLDTLTDAMWERSGRRSDGATFTVESLVRYLTHDPMHHVYDVTGQKMGSLQ